MLRKLFSRLMVFSFVLLVGTACSPYFHQPIGKEKGAQLGPETPVKQDLLDLPAPKEPIVVAVYKFRDQTGPVQTFKRWGQLVDGSNTGSH